MIPSWLNVAQKALFYGNLEECGTNVRKLFEYERVVSFCAVIQLLQKLFELPPMAYSVLV